MARPTDLAKWHEWAERLWRFERSGMSLCAWCRQERLSEVQFYLWRRKLAAHGWLKGRQRGSGHIGQTLVLGRSNRRSNGTSALGHNVQADRTRLGRGQHAAACRTGAKARTKHGPHRSCSDERRSQGSSLFVPVEVVGSSIIEVLLPCGVKVRVPSNDRRALRTVLRLATRMVAYTQDGRVPIDNNGTERNARPVAVGRNNWLFFQSVRGGEDAAALMTLIHSAQLNAIETYAYLKDVVEQLLAGNTDYRSLCPHHWVKSHPEAVRRYRVEESREALERKAARRALRRAGALARPPNTS